jgi:hypothetical protein
MSHLHDRHTQKNELQGKVKGRCLLIIFLFLSVAAVDFAMQKGVGSRWPTTTAVAE